MGGGYLWARVYDATAADYMRVGWWMNPPSATVRRCQSELLEAMDNENTG